MELTRYGMLLGRWRWHIMVVALLGCGIAYVASSFAAPTYRATTTLHVRHEAPERGRLNELLASEQLANTFGRLMQVRSVLDRVREQGNYSMTIEELDAAISVASPPGTELLQVSAIAADPGTARDIANLVANAFIGSSLPDSLGRSTDVAIVELAEAPGFAESPNRLRNSILGGFIAALVAAVVVFARDHLDTAIRSVEQIERVAGLPTLGQIEYRHDADARGLASPSEAFRGARTNLDFALRSRTWRSTLLVTSPGHGEGKSMTVANLAVVVALAGARVVVVDANLTRPAMHLLLGASSSAGLSTILLSPQAVRPLPIQETEYRGVSLLAAGPAVENAQDLLLTTGMRTIMDELASQFDLVLVDTPPVLARADAIIISRVTSASIIVVSQGETSERELVEAVRRIAASENSIVGVILNVARPHGVFHRHRRPGRLPMPFG